MAKGFRFTLRRLSFLLLVFGATVLLIRVRGRVGRYAATHSFKESVTEVTTTRYPLFQRHLESEELNIVKDLVEVFNTTMTGAGVPFFLYSGSLLGSWRHHGLVPWDDDVDFAIPFNRTKQARALLRALKPNYFLNTRQRVRWKLYSKHSRRIRGRKHVGVDWSFPFLDVSFYLENQTHIWDNDTRYPEFVFPKEDVFPLTSRPFLELMVPAPRDTESVLRRTYNLTLCSTATYDHRTEDFTPENEKMSVDCRELEGIHPFVRRVSVARIGCVETLVLNDTMLSWRMLQDLAC